MHPGRITSYNVCYTKLLRYMHAIERCLAAGRQAIMLVPEISLTPQTVGLFQERFSDGIVITSYSIHYTKLYESKPRKARTLSSRWNTSLTVSVITSYSIHYTKLYDVLPAILIGLTVHEWAHAYAAYRLGDPTARNLGRMTLNPLAHVDLFGFLMLLLVGFGWAKPVPVNPRNFKNYRRDDIIVSLAGIFTNVVIAFLFSFVYVAGILKWGLGIV